MIVLRIFVVVSLTFFVLGHSKKLSMRKKERSLQHKGGRRGGGDEENGATTTKPSAESNEEAVSTGAPAESTLLNAGTATNKDAIEHTTIEEGLSGTSDISDAHACTEKECTHLAECLSLGDEIPKEKTSSCKEVIDMCKEKCHSLNKNPSEQSSRTKDSLGNIIINENFGGNSGSGAQVELSEQQLMIPGVQQIGVGYDVGFGSFRLPLVEWKTVHKMLSPAHPLRGASYPEGIAVSTSHAGKSTQGPTVYSSQAQYTRRLAQKMQISQTEGALTMSRGAQMMRDLSLYSDLTVKETDYSLYELSMFENSEKYAISTEFLNALNTSLPDCMLTDCVVSEDKDIADTDKGCREAASTGIFVPHMSSSTPTEPDYCKAWATKGAADSGPSCSSKFFSEVPFQFWTKSAKSFKACPEDEVKKANMSQPNKERECIVFGVDEGNICNANDIQRISAFVARWGTHYVVEGAFGGSFKQLVQTTKDSAWKQAVTGQEKVFHFGSDTLPGLEASTALRGTAYSSPSFPQSFPFNSSGVLSTTELRHSLEERAGLEDMGIQSIRYDFKGGASIPVSTEKLFVGEMKEWISSLRSSPSIIEDTIRLSSLENILDHPDVTNKDKLGWSRSRKERAYALLGNFMKFWNVKSSALGNMLDQAAVIRSQQDFQLARMHGAVHETVSAISQVKDRIEMMNRDGSAFNIDPQDEINVLMAKGVVTWQQATQRYVATCRSLCDMSYAVSMRKKLLHGDFTLPSTWRKFPASPDPASHDGLKQLRDMLRVDRHSCYSTCMADVTLARQSHEPEGYVGQSKELIHEFFSLVKAGCLICRGMVKHLLEAAIYGNGRGPITAKGYCENDLWASWSDNYFKDQVFDTTQPFAFSQANTQKESPEKYDYPIRFCRGLSKVLLDPIAEHIRHNGLMQVVDKPDLYRALQIYSMTEDGTPETLSDELCAAYSGCSPGGPGPIEREIMAEETELAQLKTSEKMQKENIEAMKQSKGKNSQAQVKALSAVLKEEAKKVKTIEKHLVTLKKQQNETAKQQKAIEQTCIFECYKKTEWGKAFGKKANRINSGLQDPIPMSQLTAMRATKPCGYPVTLKKDPQKGEKSKCSKCSELSCLVQARLKCYGYSCKSEYVSTNGVAFYVPKTVLI